MKKILIIRFSSIGDIVLTTPIIRCIKNQLGAEVHFLTKKGFESILDHNEYIDKKIVFDGNISDTSAMLRRESYDLVIDLQKNAKSRLIRNKIGVKSITFDKLNVKKWLLTTFKINRLPKRHLIDRYFDAVKEIGVVNDGQGCDFNVLNEDRLVSNRHGLPSEYNVLVLGATYFTKRIPEEKCKEIINLSSLPVVLIGGKDVSELGSSLLKFRIDKVINLCGQISLRESAAVMEVSERVITADTGMMHIAAALRCKIDVIWGNTTPDFGMYPYLPKVLRDEYTNHEVKGLPCRPCSKLGFDKCPKGHFKCMMDQDFSTIF